MITPSPTFLSRARLLSTIEIRIVRSHVRNNKPTRRPPPRTAVLAVNVVPRFAITTFSRDFSILPGRRGTMHPGAHRPPGTARRPPAACKPISSRSAITLRARVTAPQRADTGGRTDAYAAESVFARAPRTTIDAPRRGVLLPFVAAAAAVITPLH